MDTISDVDDIQKLTEGDINDIFDKINFENEQANNKEEEIDKDKCPRCNVSDQIIEDTSQGARVCTNCGQVLDKLFDKNPEWKSYGDDNGSAEQGRCNVVHNILLPQSSLGTKISGNYMNKLKMLHGWNAMPYKERSLNTVFNDIHSKCKKAGLLKCIEDDAKIMYKTVSEVQHTNGDKKGKAIIVRGGNRKSLIASCVFFACKRKNVTRSPREIADLFNIKYTEMTKGVKHFLKLIKDKKINVTVGASKPEDFAQRYCNDYKPKLTQEQCELAIKISKNVRKLTLATEHTPAAIAATSMLIMAEIHNLKHMTKKILSEKYDVSEITIAKSHKKIDPYKNILSNDVMVDKIIDEINQKLKDDEMPPHIRHKLEKHNECVDNEATETKKTDDNVKKDAKKK